MSATPITPGRAYRVRGAGQDVVVLARHAADAICIVLAAMQVFA